MRYNEGDVTNKEISQVIKITVRFNNIGHQQCMETLSLKCTSDDTKLIFLFENLF